MMQLSSLTPEDAAAIYHERGHVDPNTGVAIFKFDDRTEARRVHHRLKGAGFSPSINGGGYQIIFTKDETETLFGWMDIQQGSRDDYDRMKIIQRDDFTCQRCGETFKDNRPLEVDHVVQESDGGPHDESNLVTLCIGCHARKDDFTVGEKYKHDHRVERAYGYALSEGRQNEYAVIRTAEILGVSVERAEELISEVTK